MLSRFRQENVAFVADIKGMFHQVLVEPTDCISLRFLWWPNNDLSADPVDYQMLVHVFGAKSSPSVADYALKKVAIDNETNADERTSQTIQNNFYVDDCVVYLIVMTQSDLSINYAYYCKRVVSTSLNFTVTAVLFCFSFQGLIGWLKMCVTLILLNCPITKSYLESARRFQCFFSRISMLFSMYVFKDGSTLKVEQWKYVGSDENLADIASLGIRQIKFTTWSLWLQGPEFLLRNEDEWPRQPHFIASDLSHDQTEIKINAALEISNAKKRFINRHFWKECVYIV